jgi:hypothetical protein
MTQGKIILWMFGFFLGTHDLTELVCQVLQT